MAKRTEEIKDKILGFFTGKGNREAKAEDKAESAKVTSEPSQPTYSVTDQAFADALGIPVAVIANWRSVNPDDKRLDSKRDSRIIASIREFRPVSSDPERIEKEVREHVQANYTVSVKTGYRGEKEEVVISYKTQEGWSYLNADETRDYVSKVSVKTNSPMSTPWGNQYDGCECYYSDYCQYTTQTSTKGEYKIEHKLQSAGRQVFFPKDGGLYCTYIQTCGCLVRSPGVIQDSYHYSDDPQTTFDHFSKISMSREDMDGFRLAAGADGYINSSSKMEECPVEGVCHCPVDGFRNCHSIRGEQMEDAVYGEVGLTAAHFGDAMKIMKEYSKLNSDTQNPTEPNEDVAQ
ncbi:MAG: hypothetical protein IJD48_01530 [Clostridia bacterium]|nr:hypothetical protein [Clostridia bacterium]